LVDNVTADAGAGGATFATDDDGTAHHPYVKVEFGADDTQTKVSSSNPLPIDWAGTPPPIGAGTEAAALRVTVATDSTGVVSVDDNGGALTVDNGGTFATQVDGAALTALQLIDDVVHIDDTATHATGTTKGALIMGAATPTDGSVDANDIGAVAMSTDRRLHTDTQIVGQDADLTIADGGNAITVDWAGTAPPIGAGTEAAALRVTVATDSTGVLSVDDNGGALTVDNAGTFAIQVSDTSFAVADGNALGEGVLIQGDDGTDRKNINVDATTGDVQVDVTNTVTVGSHAVTNAGTFVVQEDGAALTALQLLDDIVYTDDTSTHATGTSKGAGIMAAATPTDGSVAANDIGMLAMSLDRRLHVDADITASVALDVSAATITVASHAVTNAGTFATQLDGDALTALQLIDKFRIR